jgi:hypothetical protein
MVDKARSAIVLCLEDKVVRDVRKGTYRNIDVVKVGVVV